MAALGAIVASAVAGAIAPDAHAAKKKKAPVITSIAPTAVAVDQKLTIRGRYFKAGRYKNTVAFKRDKGKAVFVKAEVATKKMIRVTIPGKLVPQMAVRDGSPVPTSFRLRVLAKRFGKTFTKGKLVPLIGPPVPPNPEPPKVDPDGDCDSDGVKNGVDTDDDNDLLLDSAEKGLPYPLDPCKFDTDGDGVGDGFEFRSARDLNNDEYQNLNVFLPFPGRRPYPNPLDPKDAHTDFDGDSLTLAEEHSLWKYTLAHGSAAPTPEQLNAPAAALTYSDGAQYSVYRQVHGDDRRSPALAAAGYVKEGQFHQWLQQNGYWVIHRPNAGEPNSSGPILDVNRDGAVSASFSAAHDINETHYLDDDGNGWLSDDERDEDADGLSNWDETHGRMQPEWWVGKYKREKPFRITYAGTRVDNPDTDGDGIFDGADDQDHDDVPNIVELSRKANTGRDYDPTDLAVELGNPSPTFGRVQPFNPCEPFTGSRTCPRHIPFVNAWAPFDAPPWDPEGDDPNYLVLN
jgi:hypothetical protein